MHANNTGALGDFWHDLASRLRLGQRPPRTGVAAWGRGSPARPCG